MSLPGKTAVVLFNLGGPDRPSAVQPFLFNLFNDPAIIGAPGAIRWALAQFISRRRTPVAQEIYERLGGGSPLLPNTVAQAEALDKALVGESKCFIAMRYWHPLAAETVAQVKNYAPDRIVLLPLYPQFSTTTTGSSIANWHKAAEAGGLNIPTQTLCCYFENSPFVATIATRVLQALDAEPERTTRVLFTAHGLPKKVIDAGDPYQWQIERTADAIVTAIGRPDLDWTVCYQSRVGPLEWIQPYTSDELEQAGDDERSVIVVPIGFISEHSETLVELDIEYRELAEKAGVPHYTRVETVGTDDGFIGGLAQLVETVATQEAPLTSERGSCKCPDMYAGCPHRAG